MSLTITPAEGNLLPSTTGLSQEAPVREIQALRRPLNNTACPGKIRVPTQLSELWKSELVSSNRRSGRSRERKGRRRQHNGTILEPRQDLSAKKREIYAENN